MVQVDTPVALWVLEVAPFEPQGEVAEVDLEGCKTSLTDRTKIPTGLKVVLVRAVLRVI